tara:strand:- start:130 stop:282 length:153 start_codon:yes stop_codon:yes gene_type:complete
MFRRLKQILNTLGRTFMPHLYDLNPKLKPKSAPAPKPVKKAPAKKAAKKK